LNKGLGDFLQRLHESFECFFILKAERAFDTFFCDNQKVRSVTSLHRNTPTETKHNDSRKFFNLSELQ